MIDFQYNINVYPNGKSTGEAAGKAIEACIVDLQKSKEDIRIVFAAAPSQDSTLAYLSQSSVIDWSRVTAFHMDEYLGLANGAPQLFSSYLERNIFSNIELKAKHIIDATADIDSEVKRYTQLLNEGPIDVVCLGIGENGHIAFNDPPVADFDDEQVVKMVELDKECRIQQVNDGCFPSFDDVPKKALTLTIPTLLKGENLFCVVLGSLKSSAVKDALTGPISTDCPASILTTHANCKFYFDKAAFEQLPAKELSNLTA
ncbi:glucosamine-6-phosphate deaminase [Spirosomataceae bacterium TFI 002]|nr:glucosamine-6-phosphate deaminase [Spirosomataceae bacterium TFI 002]